MANSLIRPLYIQIEDSLRASIMTGEFSEGDRLPSENLLAREFTTTRSTVRQALAKLEFEGLIARHPGLGTFVDRRPVSGRLDTTQRQSFEEQMEAQGQTPTFKLLAFVEEQASNWVADRLGLPEGGMVFRLERLRMVDNELVGIEERFILVEYASEIPASDLENVPALIFMDNISGGPIEQAIVTEHAALASRELAQKLGTTPGSAVLVRDHVFLGRQEKPVLCGSAIYLGQRYQFTYKLENRKGTSLFSKIT